MDVTGQNVANVNTDGYSRQRVDMQSIGGTAVPADLVGEQPVGPGVNADQVIRIRDAFLEARAHGARRPADLTVQNATLRRSSRPSGSPATPASSRC